jgi:hypothetical protein
MLVEKEVVAAEMWAAHMPVEVLGLHVEREDVGQKRIERARDVAGSVGAKVGRRIEFDLAAFFGRHLLIHRSLLGLRR